MAVNVMRRSRTPFFAHSALSCRWGAWWRQRTVLYGSVVERLPDSFSCERVFTLPLSGKGILGGLGDGRVVGYMSVSIFSKPFCFDVEYDQALRPPHQLRRSKARVGPFRADIPETGVDSTAAMIAIAEVLIWWVVGVL